MKQEDQSWSPTWAMLCNLASKNKTATTKKSSYTAHSFAHCLSVFYAVHLGLFGVFFFILERRMNK
jgi:hypothetical protein